MTMTIDTKEANNKYFGMKLPRPGQGCVSDTLSVRDQNKQIDQSNLTCEHMGLCLTQWCKIHRRENPQDENHKL